MSFVKEILTPVVSMSVLIAFLTGVGWMIYRGLNKLMPDLNLWLKFKLFKRKMSEETIEWCYNLHRLNADEVEAEMLLLRKGNTPKQISETLYIFREVAKELKGGVEDE